MRTLVLYKSSSGSTKKYAEDIAKLTEADLFELKKFKFKNIDNYDTIVFGGWVMGGKIQGLDDFLANWDDMEEKNVIVFSSGMSMTSKEGRATLINENILDMYHLRYYQLRGSFNYKKLPFYYKLLMDNSLRMIAKDENASADQRMLLTVKETPIEWYDQEKVDRIVKVIHDLSIVEVKAEDKE